jgi:hypothetical protein
VIGDVIEVPNEVQFDHNLNAVHKWLEVTDVGWDPQGVTTNWRPALVKVKAEPMLATQETKDLVGLFGDRDSLASDVLALNPEPNMMSGMADEASQVITAMAADAVPQTGEDATGIASGLPSAGPIYPDPTNDGTQYSVEDGLPPDNAPYLELSAFPQSPNDGDYVRILYPSTTFINPRLFRYSAISQRWIFLEEDKRMQYNSYKLGIQQLLDSPTSQPLGL